MTESQCRKLRKLTISQEHLGQLSSEVRATLAAFSFHISEINTIWRLYGASKIGLSGSRDLDLAISIQQNTVLRIWSSKIFEFVNGFPQKTKDNELSDFFDRARAKILGVYNGNNQKNSIFSRIRDECTFHLEIEKLAGRFPYVNKDACTDFFFDKMEASSFFPYGEEVVFAGSFNRFANRASAFEKEEILKEWAEWIFQASKCLTPLFDEFLLSFVFSAANPVSWSWVNINLADGMVGEFGAANVPLFLSNGPEQ